MRAIHALLLVWASTICLLIGLAAYCEAEWRIARFLRRRRESRRRGYVNVRRLP